MTKEQAVYFMGRINEVSVEISAVGSDDDTVILVQSRLEEALEHLIKASEQSAEGAEPPA